MLIDTVLACAPIVVLVPVVVTLLGSRVDYTPKAHVQKRVLESLTLAERLPEGIVGSAQIARDIDRQTMHLAYLTQYPQRGREIRDIALIGIGLVATLAVYYVLLWSDAAMLYLWAFLALVVGAALWLERAVVNFARNDTLACQLFAHFRAPENLLRPNTELVLKAPALTVETLFERAADVRDAHLGGSMSTLEAVNSVLAQAHTHGAWRRELRHLAHRVRTTDYRARGAAAYDWLLRHLLGPFFRWRRTVRSRWLLQIRVRPFSGRRARAAHLTARQTCGASIAATTTAATTTAATTAAACATTTSAASAAAMLIVVLARSPDAALSELRRHCDHQEGHTTQRQNDHPAQTRAGHDRTLRPSAPAA